MESQLRYKKIRKTKREPRWNLIPLQEDERSGKFASMISWKRKRNPNNVEQRNGIALTIAEVAEEQLMINRSKSGNYG
jgi:uncharacterized protein YdbL (DUF1318 family)